MIRAFLELRLRTVSVIVLEDPDATLLKGKVARVTGKLLSASRSRSSEKQTKGQDKDCARSPVPISAGEEGIHDSASVPRFWDFGQTSQLCIESVGGMQTSEY